MDHKSITILFILANLLVLVVYSSPHNKNDFLKCLTMELQTSNSPISSVNYTPRNSSHDYLLRAQKRLRFTSIYTPQLTMKPVHESEIQAAIHCSKKLGIQIRVQSGGHDFERLTTISESPFVLVDMRNLRSISVDTEEKTAWVQTGAQLGELYQAIASKSKTLGFPAGNCPTVGVGGHFSGGGYSMMSRKHSIAADHIIDAKLVNADGQILDRKSMGEDLFWAIRGGGSTSFGIILAFKVNLVTVPEIVTVFDISKTLEQNATQLVHKWQYISDSIDDNLLIRVYMKNAKSPIDGKRKTRASFSALFLGPVNDLKPIMQEKFPELGMVEQDCKEMSWINSTLYFGKATNVPIDTLLKYKIHYKGKSDFVTHPIPVRGIRGIWRFLEEESANKFYEMQFSPYGGAFDTYSENETPFPHRSGNKFMIEYAMGWMGRSERQMNWLNRFFRYMGRYASKSPRAAYFNYRDLDIGRNGELNTSYEQARVWGFKYFKNNFARLVRVKTKVDPSNFFRNEQSIPPLYPSLIQEM